MTIKILIILQIIEDVDDFKNQIFPKCLYTYNPLKMIVKAQTCVDVKYAFLFLVHYKTRMLQTLSTVS